MEEEIARLRAEIEELKKRRSSWSDAQDLKIWARLMKLGVKDAQCL